MFCMLWLWTNNEADDELSAGRAITERGLSWGTLLPANWFAPKMMDHFCNGWVVLTLDNVCMNR